MQVSCCVEGVISRLNPSLGSTVVKAIFINKNLFWCEDVLNTLEYLRESLPYANIFSTFEVSNPIKKENYQSVIHLDSFSSCSATRTRTGVYGVRGRCPRPLDDSTLVTAPFFESECKGTAFF